MTTSPVIAFIFLAIIIVLFLKAARVVPHDMENIVERLGKYDRTLGPGFHILLPFLDRVVGKRSLGQGGSEEGSLEKIVYLQQLHNGG